MPEIPETLETSAVSSTATIDPTALKKLFPIFSNKPDYVFFDNASTSQKPATVIDGAVKFHSQQCANPGRGSYQMASLAARKIEEARGRVAQFLNAAPEEIAFTSGATESLNLSALSWGLANLADGDEIMVCLEDHKSTVYPWFVVKDFLEQRGCRIKIVPFSLTGKGVYDQSSIKAGLSAKTRLVALTHVHNLYGLDTGAGNMRSLIGSDILISLDASQSVGHMALDVQALAVDFLVFSGHKMFADYGVGVIWVSPRIKAKLKPARLGGGSPVTVADGNLKLDFDSVRALFESGSPNVPAIISMLSALDLLEQIGLGQIERHLADLSAHLLEELKSLPGIEFAPGLAHNSAARGTGIISFRFNQVGSAELAFALGEEKILVRGGEHCLSNKSDKGWLRVSMHIYNSRADITRLILIMKDLLGLEQPAKRAPPAEC